jgi:NAD(P)-dependent dehydrogenase (short-subunit alcohol dehydrogenase family)
MNNAGLADNFLVEATTVAQDQLSFEVNVFGLLRLTRAMLPLLRLYRKSHPGSPKPRVVMVSSVAGLYSGPRLGAYAATKHAVEAYTTSLRVEIAPFGVDVVSLNVSRIWTFDSLASSTESVSSHTTHKPVSSGTSEPAKQHTPLPHPPRNSSTDTKRPPNSNRSTTNRTSPSTKSTTSEWPRKDSTRTLGSRY